MKRDPSDRRRRSNSQRTNDGVETSNSGATGSSRQARLQRSLGNQAMQRLHEAGLLQAKLEVSQPGDPHEREAERVAQAVMRMEDPVTRANRTADVQRSASGDSPTSGGDLEGRIQSLRGGGRPLSESTRSYFEPRFGRDFGDVRVHTGPKADEAARSINAQAFTLGNDVVFARGQYQPGTQSGKELMAHELTHVVQQGGGDAMTSTAGNGHVARQFGLGEYLGFGGESESSSTSKGSSGTKSGNKYDTYTVERGDSLWAIANEFDVEGGARGLAKMNGMSVDDPIHPGEELKVPAGKGSKGKSGSKSRDDGGDGESLGSMLGDALRSLVSEKPKWIRLAEGEIGTKEKGRDWSSREHWEGEEKDLHDKAKQESNPEIEKYHKVAGLKETGWAGEKFHGGSEKSTGVGDHVYWCGSFVSWAIKKAGHELPTYNTSASGWIGWGQGTKDPEKAQYGSVVVVKGGDHVGFLVGKTGETLHVLGGNQDDAVNVSNYSAINAKWFGLPEGFDTSTLPPLRSRKGKEGGDTR